jgi:hypothetical protein
MVLLFIIAHEQPDDDVRSNASTTKDHGASIGISDGAVAGAARSGSWGSPLQLGS